MISDLHRTLWAALLPLPNSRGASAKNAQCLGKLVTNNLATNNRTAQLVQGRACWPMHALRHHGTLRQVLLARWTQNMIPLRRCCGAVLVIVDATKLFVRCLVGDYPSLFPSRCKEHHQESSGSTTHEARQRSESAPA